jgi:hypothetical protein
MFGYPAGRPQLHAEWAISTSNTFQSDRSARFILAYPEHAEVKMAKGLGPREQKGKNVHF